ncbi:MmpS family transport accessory protein [Streptomyces sp. NPDC002773]|uniref:MmpS family transport accessory protein n=1 Tax=Streptomyces sp. NPDC002773 TaxID=3154430 RepID=UPI003332B779
MDSVNSGMNRRSGRRGALLAVAAAVVLLLCGGVVGYGVLADEEKPPPAAAETAEVTYEVSGNGTADISYLGGGDAGEAVVEQGVVLPWKKTVRAPKGKAPTVGVVLDAKGGQATCALAVRGRHVQRATATGTFGRATCTGTPG